MKFIAETYKNKNVKSYFCIDATKYSISTCTTKKNKKNNYLA